LSGTGVPIVEVGVISIPKKRFKKSGVLKGARPIFGWYPITHAGKYSQWLGILLWIGGKLDYF